MGSNKRYPNNRHYWTVEEWLDGWNKVIPSMSQHDNPTDGRAAFAAAVAAHPGKLLTLCWGGRIIEFHPNRDWFKQPPIMPVWEMKAKG